jgi:hypothetical protein
MSANIINIIIVHVNVVFLFGIVPSQLDRQTVVAERMVSENERVGSDVRRGSESNVLFATGGELVLFAANVFTVIDTAVATSNADSGRRGRKRENETNEDSSYSVGLWL